MPKNNPSLQIIQQRTRNRIIDYLECASSFEEQREYAAAVPIAHVPSEMICGWSDWVRDENIESYGPPVFEENETLAIRRFHATWETVTRGLPRERLPLEEIQQLEQWAMLRAAAEEALSVFLPRGRLSEDDEI